MNPEKENMAQGGHGALVDPAADARTRLIQAGLEAFGMYNYEGAGTREIARLAGVNLSAIPYHFGGKRGLYEAVVEYIAAQLFEKAGPELNRGREMLERGEAGTDKLLEALTSFLEQAARAMLLTPEARFWARIMLREQMLPTGAFDRLYREALCPAHTALTELTARISGLPGDSPEAAIRAFTLLGQVLVFRATQETVKRRLGWQAVDEENFELIRRVIRANTAAILRGGPGGGER